MQMYLRLIMIWLSSTGFSNLALLQMTFFFVILFNTDTVQENLGHLTNTRFHFARRTKYAMDETVQEIQLLRSIAYRALVLHHHSDCCAKSRKYKNLLRPCNTWQSHSKSLEMKLGWHNETFLGEFNHFTDIRFFFLHLDFKLSVWGLVMCHHYLICIHR